MIIRCCVCNLHMGEKEPLADRSETHTYCHVHYLDLLAQIDAQKTARKEALCVSSPQ